MKFKTSHSDAWHKSINDTVGQRKPTDANFPWTALQNHTGYYLQRKGNLSADQVDQYLLALIKKHPSKQAAVAACAQALSLHSIRNLLRNDLRVDLEGTDALQVQGYFETIIIANHVNAKAVSHDEAKSARCLLQYSIASEPERAPALWLYSVLPLLRAAPAPDLLLQDEIHRIASALCSGVATQLKDLRRENKWLEAKESIRWLTAAFITSNSPQELLLDTLLPAWRAWAAWRPHVPRLRNWKSHGLRSYPSLRDLLALEGPDFVSGEGSEQATLRDGLIAQTSSSSQPFLQWGRFSLAFGRNPFRELENLNGIFGRLMSVIDSAGSSCMNYKSLLAHLCCDNVISNEGLQTLESVRLLNNPSFTSMILQALTKPKRKLYKVIREVRTLLPIFEDLRLLGLRDQMQLYVGERSYTYIRELRNTLLIQLRIGSPSLDTAVELLGFTLELQKYTWLVGKLDPSVQHLIASGPSSIEIVKTLDAVIDFVKDAMVLKCPTLLSQLISYYNIWLMPSSSVDPNVRELINTLTDLWHQRSDGGSRELALLIADLPLFTVKFRCDCLRDITTFDMIWTKSALEALHFHDGNADLGCFSLIKLLSSETRPDILERWGKVLSSVIEKESERLLEDAVTNLKTAQWLELLGHIRAVYDDSGMIIRRQPHGLLCRELHDWSQQIVPYLPEMTHLESVLKNKSVMRLLLLGNFDETNTYLLRVLGLVKNKESEIRGRLMYSIIELLSIANVKRVEGVLSVVSKASDDGAKACLRVIESIHNASSGMDEVILATTLRFGNIAVADRLALKDVAALFGITLADKETPSPKGLKEAAETLYKQYQNLISEARRVENLRLSLRTVAPKRVSNLLVRLHIEAPSAVDDTLASLPSSLCSLAAKVSENELELQFPATSLTKLQRFAIGAGDTDNFLVRLTLNESGKPIKFCIHLSSELRHQTKKGALQDKDHTSWEVFRGNRPPYEQYCHGQPNRGVYQFSRILWHHLRHNFKSLEQTHAYMTSKLSKFGQGCMVCGRGQLQLRRVTTCGTPSCSNDALKSTH